MKVSFLVPLVFFAKVSATPLLFGLDTEVCDGAVTIASTWIGEAKNVEIISIYCPDLHERRDVQHMLEQPQTAPLAPFAKNVCGAPCATNCFTPAGGGPDPNECHVIADALRFDSQQPGIGPFVTVNPGTGSPPTGNSIVLKYNSCETFFLNQVSVPLTYCLTDWAALVDFVAFNCQATQNAHGGNCVANDQSWFVQVNHS